MALCSCSLQLPHAVIENMSLIVYTAIRGVPRCFKRGGGGGGGGGGANPKRGAKGEWL